MTASDFPLLRGLDEAERRGVVAAGSPRRFAAREVVFHEGDPGDTLHLVVTGRVAVRATTPLGRTATLNLLGAGDVFGEMAVLDPGARRTATVVALEPTHTLRIDGTRFAAAPQHQTLTVLNCGKVLATRNGAAITAAPQTGNGAQQFELLFPGSAGSSEPGFGSAFQLKNKNTGKCLRDNGPGAQVSEVVCFANPAQDSTQLWQQHVATDREVGGKRWFFVFNRHTDRVLSQKPVFGTTIPVLSSVPASNVGSAAAAHQLWNFQRV